MEMRRVYLANWALRTSPKFTTGFKYQFHQGFWPVQRSGNPNHPSPPSWGQCDKIKFSYKSSIKINYQEIEYFYNKNYLTNHVKIFLLHWTLTLSEHRLGQNGLAMANHHSLAQNPAQYWQNESWGSAGGGGTTMDWPAKMGIIPQNSFYIIISLYWG